MDISAQQVETKCRRCPCVESDHGGEHRLCANCPLCEGFVPRTQPAVPAQVDPGPFTTYEIGSGGAIGLRTRPAQSAPIEARKATCKCGTLVVEQVDGNLHYGAWIPGVCGYDWPAAPEQLTVASDARIKAALREVKDFLEFHEGTGAATGALNNRVIVVNEEDWNVALSSTRAALAQSESAMGEQR